MDSNTYYESLNCHSQLKDYKPTSYPKVNVEEKAMKSQKFIEPGSFKTKRKFK